LVIHGEADRLVDVSGGRATAAAVPGAELVLIPGMGHDLPEGAWSRIVEVDRSGSRCTSRKMPQAGKCHFALSSRVFVWP
jgi:hypothetical protein